MKTYESGCFCGAVALALSGEPEGQLYCHCRSCRGWLGAPIHAGTGWPTAKVAIVRGADRLATFRKTEASHRRFCSSCGSPVLIVHPAIGITDIPAGTIAGFVFEPKLHVHYGERVLRIRDGLPKYRDLPESFGGSGVTLPE